MKLAFQLAYRNLLGAGLRTWLNVGVLSFAFVIIIFYNGWIDGWNQQARRDSIAWQYGFGQLQVAIFDPFDPFSITDAHAALPAEDDHLTPVLLRLGTLYPQGRTMSIVVKGIDVNQTVVDLPTSALTASKSDLPAIIGEQIALASHLRTGDEVLLRWRDIHGTFDAATVTIAGVFPNQVPGIDKGQIWVPLKKLQDMTLMPDEATYFIADANFQHTEIAGWKYRSQEDLLYEINNIIKMKKMGGSVMYLLLLAIALLAIFDTQVLSVFRRQKEIGTYISLGMTRQQVVGLFTVEGAMTSIFAAVLGALYGTPLLGWIAHTGIAVPMNSQDLGIPIADRMYPVFGLGLILATLMLVVISATIVSFLPSRKIAKMDPVQALKGKIQ